MESYTSSVRVDCGRLEDRCRQHGRLQLSAVGLARGSDWRGWSVRVPILRGEAAKAQTKTAGGEAVRSKMGKRKGGMDADRSVS
ncbi:hypothetical protein CRG98_008760 [Punica granatum]|uniref:Uncharacterized protein n=1 Tax=Punica granatum TaxID=22663 RepID=A0A2I0KQX9_PUNGR|nr:hypothetical protein CRG98_008760 [Punica granatum]